MNGQAINVYNRYTAKIEQEQIYGEAWLRRVYETPVGGKFVELILKRAWWSRYYGWRMNKRVSGGKVLPFVVKYEIPAEDFAKHPWEFSTFNEFFSRTLRKGARPITPGERVAVMPADGRHLVFPNVDVAEGFYVKGAHFSLAELLGDAELARRFVGGAMLISRLCPVDYHRFHFPVAGTPDEARLINGWLYSVSTIALRKSVRYLVENKRMVTLIDAPDFGRVAMLEIGATCVGTIKQLYLAGRAYAKGDEKGLFKFGGSCVVTLFERDRIRFDDDLVAQSKEYRETYVRMGDRLGEAT